MNRLGFIFSSFWWCWRIASSMLFVVDQRQFGVVYALGQIKEVITEPGLNFKLPPPFQNVSYIDKRLLTLDSTDTEPMLTAEKQRVVIDWYVRWRISEPTEYIRNVGPGRSRWRQSAQSRGAQCVPGRNQQAHRQGTVVTQARGLDGGRQARGAGKVRGAKPWGVDVVDVRITRADYVEAITESVYRAWRPSASVWPTSCAPPGAAEGEKIRADADRQREVTVANAYRDAQKIKGEGDAEAARIYAEAFGRDPQFAQFYRSLDAYKASFGKKSDVMVLDPASSEFFKASAVAPRRLPPGKK
jgi:membrane protease subunit HflC